MKREVIDWKIRSPRRPANVVGTALRDDGSSFRVLVVNISYEGCHILCEQALVTGETLSVELPGKGAMKAQVRWVDGDKAGLRFLFLDSVFERRRARLGV